MRKPQADLSNVVDGGTAAVQACYARYYQQGLDLLPEQIATLQEVQTECGMRLASLEDGKAVLFTDPSWRRTLRWIEQSATDILEDIADGSAEDTADAG